MNQREHMLEKLQEAESAFYSDAPSVLSPAESGDRTILGSGEGPRREEIRIQRLRAFLRGLDF